MKQLIIEGSRIHDIRSFYDEINRVFMAAEDWKLGPSLDAFNDLLYGGFGAIGNNEPVELIWNNIEACKAALGYETTKRYYEEKLLPGSPFNKIYFQEKLEELNQGKGQTYFDILMEIIAGHPNITLRS
ncbi:barstar family protein [Pseudobacter ginsenosidimutans]|uniref:Barstar (Barnase inhibitor) n=1 Tax=Pseudobacter ginsenosidimutans TaxID=661488 RepID=A0A4Q7N325_9BACT|nr:barstar family protein [Pseudobacter ginsenosidimutans]QEC44044.1 ribonuclease inhibitor [Pseudobacter ginsenosidimutans]RZS75484.1 barstar (barnase inhibitor) [Pseudobacter ginsenosidimutans]